LKISIHGESPLFRPSFEAFQPLLVCLRAISAFCYSDMGQWVMFDWQSIHRIDRVGCSGLLLSVARAEVGGGNVCCCLDDESGNI